jgi:hypothetical protein
MPAKPKPPANINSEDPDKIDWKRCGILVALVLAGLLVIFYLAKFAVPERPMVCDEMPRDGISSLIGFGHCHDE